MDETTPFVEEKTKEQGRKEGRSVELKQDTPHLDWLCAYLHSPVFSSRALVADSPHTVVSLGADALCVHSVRASTAYRVVPNTYLEAFPGSFGTVELWPSALYLLWICGTQGAVITTFAGT